MKKDKIKELLKNDYKIKVFTIPNKQHDKMLLKTILTKKDCNVVYPVYYNHIKEYLNNNQIDFINNFNKAKNLSFSDDVELNIKSKNNTLTKKDMQLLVMRKSIKNLEYLEQY